MFQVKKKITHTAFKIAFKCQFNIENKLKNIFMLQPVVLKVYSGITPVGSEDHLVLGTEPGSATF